MFLLDKSGVFKGYNARLLQSSYNAQLYMMYTRTGPTNSISRVIKSLAKQDEALEMKHGASDVDKPNDLELNRASNEENNTNGEDEERDDEEREDCVDQAWRQWRRLTGAVRSTASAGARKAKLFPDNIRKMTTFHKLNVFYDYLLDRRCYLGCEGVIFSKGLCGSSVGLCEDYILHVLNNHNILACSFAAKGSPFSRSARRFCWITQHSVGFSMAALVENALIAIDCATSVAGGCRGVAVDSNSGSGLSHSIAYLNPLIKILVILPVTLSLSKAVRALYTCSFTRNKQFESRNPYLTRVLRWAGKISAIPMLFGALLFLVIAAVLTPPGKSKLGIIVKYALQVHLVSFIKDLSGAALCMVHSYHLSVHILGVPFANIGYRYCEYILRRGLVEGVDYKHWHLSLFSDSVFHIDYIYPMRRLIDDTSRGSEINYSSKGSSDMVSFQVNPLHQLARGRSVTQLELVQQRVQQPEERPMEAVRESVVERAVTHEAVFAPGQSTQHSGSSATFSVVNPLHQLRAPADVAEASLPSGCEESMEVDAVQIRKFDKRIRRSFINKFHYWEAREKGYHREEAVDRFDLKRFKQLHGIAEAGGGAINRGVSAPEAVMKMSKKVDLSASARHGARLKKAHVTSGEDIRDKNDDNLL